MADTTHINNPQITLASSSPRRAELLEQIGVSFDVKPVDIDESYLPGETAEQYVSRLARQKAQAGFALSPECPVLGSDTVVVCQGKILGKPVDKQMGLDMLSLLSGQSHQVMTAVCLVNSSFERCLVNISEVNFCSLSSEQIEAYWETGEPADKAGSYGIQGLAAQYIKEIRGSYSCIMGLPLYETAELLKQAGIKLPGNI